MMTLTVIAVVIGWHLLLVMLHFYSRGFYNRKFALKLALKDGWREVDADSVAGFRHSVRANINGYLLQFDTNNTGSNNKLTLFFHEPLNISNMRIAKPGFLSRIFGSDYGVKSVKFACPELERRFIVEGESLDLHNFFSAPGNIELTKQLLSTAANITVTPSTLVLTGVKLRSKLPRDYLTQLAKTLCAIADNNQCSIRPFNRDNYTFKNLKPITISVSKQFSVDIISKAATLCPFCRDFLNDDSETSTCDSCQTPHHAECLREAGGCTVYACRNSAKLKSRV